MPPYNPIPLANLRPGTPASYWDYSAQNNDELYEDTVCHLAAAGNLYNVSTTATSYYAPYLAFRMAKNLDNQKLRVKVRVKTDDSYGVALAYVKVVLDGTDLGVQSTTSNTGEWLTIDITPTTATADRAAYVYLKTSDASVTAQVLAINAYIVGAAPAAGVLASDFISFDLTASAPSGAPIATEYVERLGDGPIRIAKDRLLCVGSFIDNCVTPRAIYASTSTDWDVVYLGSVYIPDTMVRDYKISIFQGPSTTSPESRVTLGNQVKTFTGTGWQEQTFSLAGSSTFNARETFQIELRNVTGTGPVGIGSIQIRRA
mgnify:CR=1 FL=1